MNPEKSVSERVRGELLPLDIYQDWTRERRERIAASARLHPYALSHPQDYETLCLAVSLLSR